MINALQKVPHLMWTSYNKRKNTEIYYFKNKCAYLKRKEEKKTSRIPPTQGEQTLKMFLFFSTTVENIFLLNEKLFLICVLTGVQQTQLASTFISPHCI